MPGREKKTKKKNKSRKDPFSTTSDLGDPGVQSASDFSSGFGGNAFKTSLGDPTVSFEASGVSAFGAQAAPKAEMLDELEFAHARAPPPSSVLDSSLLFAVENGGFGGISHASASSCPPYLNEASHGGTLSMGPSWDTGVGTTAFNGDDGVRRHVERGLQCLTAETLAAPSSNPNYVGRSAPRRDHLETPQKWNPFGLIGRYWTPTTSELTTDLSMPPILLGSSASSSKLAVQECKAAHVETATGLQPDRGARPAARAQAATQGERLKLWVQPLEGGRLGLTVTDLVVAAIADPRARDHGWVLGDKILQINGTPVQSMQYFTAELARAMAEYNALSRPVIVDVWRAANASPMLPMSTGMLAPAGPAGLWSPAATQLLPGAGGPVPVPSGASAVTLPARGSVARAALQRRHFQEDPAWFGV